MSTLKILYGSETGNAQVFAEQVWRIFYSLNIEAECFFMDDYSIQDLCNEKFVIFIVSTSGQGEVPTNMRENWSLLLSKSIGKNWLSNVNFALLALGDSSYQKYNYAGKKIYRRLIQLGANPILELALADEQHQLGIDEVYEKWISDLLKQDFIVELQNQSRIQNTPRESKFYIDIMEEKKNLQKFYPLTVLQNERLTSSGHFQDTRLITFTTNNLRYVPGDILMVLSENLPESIETAINSLSSCQPYLDMPFSICRSHPLQPKPPQYDILFGSDRRITFKECLRFYFDLQSIPKRTFIRDVANKSLDEMEHERLLELSSPEGIDDYFDYCVYSKRTLAEFLRDFPRTSAILKPIDLFNFFPVIRPRAFSIASAPNAHQGEVQILVARVQYNVKKMKTPRFGLCSNFLCSRQAGQKVYAQIRLGIFRNQTNAPLVLIGPGTGVAPFRSIISENELPTNHFSQILLFFGCRGQFKDYYFKDEWPTYKKAKIITAFSRDQESKIYVQHKILENAQEIWQSLNNGAKVFIAGAAGDMPKQVVSAIRQVIIDCGGLSAQGADKYIEMMEKRKLIQYETWS